MRTELKIGNKPTGLYAVDVPVDAKFYRISNHYIFYDRKNNVHSDCKRLPEGKYKKLGIITKDKIGFDVEPYVTCISANSGLWENYNRAPYYFEYMTKTKEESFYSLLQSNGLYFVNPMDAWHTYITKEDCDKWQHYEDHLVTKLLIIQKT